MDKKLLFFMMVSLVVSSSVNCAGQEGANERKGFERAGSLFAGFFAATVATRYAEKKGLICRCTNLRMMPRRMLVSFPAAIAGVFIFDAALDCVKIMKNNEK